jgi:hypothetical protein
VNNPVCRQCPVSRHKGAAGLLTIVRSGMTRRPKPIVLTKADVSRFWSKVARVGLNDCWVWTCGCGSGGYGAFRAGVRMLRANRVAYVICKGDTELQVLHTCNNPPCCNPAHLYAGTDKDNMRQCSRDGRVKPPIGEKHHFAKLTVQMVRKARRLYAIRWFQREIAELFGCSSKTISKLLTGKSWRSV